MFNSYFAIFILYSFKLTRNNIDNLEEKQIVDCQTSISTFNSAYQYYNNQFITINSLTQKNFIETYILVYTY